MLSDLVDSDLKLNLDSRIRVLKVDGDRRFVGFLFGVVSVE